jgi:hypothetical protein
MAAIKWKYYIVFCIFLGILVILIYCLFPETKGHSLEEIALIFDGPAREDRENGLKGEDVKVPNEKDATEVQHVEKNVHVTASN